MPTSEPQKMARPPEPSTPQSQSLPYPRGQSKLELMPTEVLNQIFKPLAQGNLQSFLDLQDEDLVHANRVAQSQMRSLCLTSKRVDTVARPLLFQNITVTSPAMSLRLYDSLLRSAQLGCHIRQISFEILFRDMNLCDFFPLSPFQSSLLLNDWGGELKYDAKFTFSKSYCDHVLSSAYFEILRRTSSIHHLVLRIQPQDRLRDDYGQPNGKYMLEPFFRLVRKEVESSLAGDGTKFLPRLSELQLLGDPTSINNPFDVAICKPLLQIQSLKKITFFRDNGNWSAFVKRGSSTPKAGCVFNHARSAELQQSTCLAHDFRALGILLADLEVLKISTRLVDLSRASPSQCLQERSLGDDNPYLQEALMKMRNLHTLTLDLCWGPCDQDEVWALKNPNLASLSKLTTLEIPLRMLVMEYRNGVTIRNDRGMGVLPKFLKRLIFTVEVDCETHYHLDDSYSFQLNDPTYPPTSKTGALVFMEMLSKVAHIAFPDLREVVCCYRMNGHEPSSKYGYDEARGFSGEDFEEEDLLGYDDNDCQRLQLLRTSLQQQQMRFKVVYRDVRCICASLPSLPSE